MNAQEALEPKIEYASLNQRMLACTVDLFLILLVAIPVSNWVLDHLLTPFTISDIAGLLNESDLIANPSKFLDTLWQVVKTHHLIERSILENLIQVIIIAAYALPFWFHYSSTPGKMLFRMQIQDADTGLPLTRKQAVLRFFAYIIAMLPFALGFFWVAFNRKRQGFHDIIANTVVIITPKKIIAQQLL
jgi:uncharacterized RDD family membrane protein YckC